MYIEPSHSHILEEGSNKVNFTWKCISQKKHTMQFQLKFVSAADISPNLPYDTIFFVTKDEFTLKNLTLSHNIKPQLTISNTTQSMIKIASANALSIKIFASMNLVISIWLQGVLNSLLGLIQNLAIVVHFPLLNNPMPANIMMINAFLIPIVTFEVLDSAVTTQLFYRFDMIK